MELTSKLAFEHKLCRETLNYSWDSKRNHLHITEKVAELKGGVVIRQEVYLHVYPEASATNITELMNRSRAEATKEFLGLGGVTKAETPVLKVVEKEEPVAAPAPEAVYVAPAEEKEATPVAKKTTKKKAAKKAVKKKAVQVVVAVQESDDEEDLLADAIEDGEENVILYDKANREHAIVHLKPIIAECLGADWREDDEAKEKVKKLIAALNGKIPVTDLEGEVLPIFGTKCRELLAA